MVSGKTTIPPNSIWNPFISSSSSALQTPQDPFIDPLFPLYCLSLSGSLYPSSSLWLYGEISQHGSWTIDRKQTYRYALTSLQSSAFQHARYQDSLHILTFVTRLLRDGRFSIFGTQCEDHLCISRWPFTNLRRKFIKFKCVQLIWFVLVF